MTLPHTCLLTLVLHMISFGDLQGKIRNGYEGQLQSAMLSFQNLNSQLRGNPNLSDEQKQTLRSKIENSIEFITCYELTQELINQLSIISPGIFSEMDTIEDRRGRPTDVYLRLIIWKEATMPFNAASFFRPGLSRDPDANVSPYGEFSVSVNIWTTDNALLLLCHELGHIKYIVPNLAEYAEFYQRRYRSPNFDLSFIGHHAKDQSGKCARAFERRFLDDRWDWQKNGGSKLVRLYALAQRTKKRLRNSDVNQEYPEPVLRAVSRQNSRQSYPAR